MPKTTDSSNLNPDTGDAVGVGKPKEKPGGDRGVDGPPKRDRSHSEQDSGTDEGGSAGDIGDGLSHLEAGSTLRRWVVYLAGEIHTNWRHEIVQAALDHGLPVEFTFPVLDHAASDYCGVSILGKEEDARWRDHKGAKINAIRTRALIAEADIVVARFDEDKKYRQWNAAFDAGYASALGKSLIVMHSEKTIHPLKEVDAAALAVAASAEEIVQILCYVTGGAVPHQHT